ncbi:type II toxin-antitoxin system RelE/ParE family toxin [Cohnella sp. GCM10027633]|uniref:type II toxin-antitoxin system RelE/ParE family toxin n=1 Tax=unclassified Cohnella TaxID=2636738 RepID=UPI00363F57C7
MTYAPDEIAKHIVEDIWELRPDKHRVMFFQAKEGKFILLSYFRKETQKTPPKQIRKAIQLRMTGTIGHDNEQLKPVIGRDTNEV